MSTKKTLLARMTEYQVEYGTQRRYHWVVAMAGSEKVVEYQTIFVARSEDVVGRDLTPKAFM